MNTSHLSPADRAAKGKSARAHVPRSSHAAFEPAADRPDPVALLESQAASRVPELVPIRYGRMLVSPFTFYRGAALVMASDLSTTPDSGLRVQACGDAHLANFGVFGSPERSLVFDINDFDETAPGPWEWDLKRLVTSLEIAGRANGHTADQRARTLLGATAAYRIAMAGFAQMTNLEVWYSRLDFLEQFQQLRVNRPAKATKRTEKAIAKARTKDSMQALEKLTEVVDGQRRIINQPPLIMRLEDLAAQQAGLEAIDVREQIEAVLRGYRRTLPTDRRHLINQYEYVDTALKVVGVGSVGTRAWIMLMLGRDSDDPLFLQAKEAQASVLERYVVRSEFRNNGQRVVAGQRLMQSTSDIFLGWHRITSPLDGQPRDFYVRQLRDWKGSADVDNIDADRLFMYGRLCAWTLAKAHARSGDRIAIAAYLGNGDVFDKAIARFAVAYAEQNDRDYEALKQAAETGRIEVVSGL
ncbi:MAG: DUF2252 domain-containing protein [Candidatus Nanopelagicales bacterium]|jgi:uncharacterized protein (DUF2252 family)|nr:DUF2252 domain-containing protein [Candidatus Nanopelagicales bacterium]MCU0299734.1 DUF2252 domain-containing protein [Candidatus Nanopelagicales bacterium]